MSFDQFGRHLLLPILFLIGIYGVSDLESWCLGASTFGTLLYEKYFIGLVLKVLKDLITSERTIVGFGN